LRKAPVPLTIVYLSVISEEGVVETPVVAARVRG
jgi:hypothetical protein